MNGITANNEPTYPCFKITFPWTLKYVRRILSFQGSGGLLYSWYFGSNVNDAAFTAETGNDMFDVGEAFSLYENKMSQDAEGLTTSLTKCAIIV